MKSHPVAPKSSFNTYHTCSAPRFVDVNIDFLENCFQPNSNQFFFTVINTLFSKWPDAVAYTGGATTPPEGSHKSHISLYIVDKAVVNTSSSVPTNLRDIFSFSITKNLYLTLNEKTILYLYFFTTKKYHTNQNTSFLVVRVGRAAWRFCFGLCDRIFGNPV